MFLYTCIQLCICAFISVIGVCQCATMSECMHAFVCIHVCVLHFYDDCTLFNALFLLVLSTAVYNMSLPFLAQVVLPIHASLLLEMCFAAPLLFGLMSLHSGSLLI